MLKTASEIKEPTNEQKWNKHHSEYKGSLFQPMGRAAQAAANSEQVRTPRSP